MIVEKIVSLGLAAALVAGLDWRSVIVCFIVLGQGHFLLAYLYQARAGKIRGLYLLNYACWAALILAVYWSHPFAAGLTAVATIYFAWHMAVDEYYLLETPLNLRSSPLHLGRLLEMVPLVLVYAAAVCDAMLAHGSWRQFPELLGPSLVVSLLAMLAYAALVGLSGYRPDRRSWAILVPGFLLDLSAKLGWLQLVPPPKLSGYIILFHYFSWYLHYYTSLSGPRRRTYLRDVVAVNALVLALYLTYAKTGPGWLFFQEQNFYLWTMMHLISSTRPHDLKALLRWPQSPTPPEGPGPN